MRRAATALAVALLALAVPGCGDDSDDSDESSAPTSTKTEQKTEAAGPPVGDRGGKAAADAFIACFKEPGYRPIRGPTTRQPAEIIAEEKGYAVEGMLMTEGSGALNSFFIQFFESAALREKATRALDLKFGSADVPEPLEKGSAAVTWVTRQVRDAVGPAVERCLD